MARILQIIRGEGDGLVEKMNPELLTQDCLSTLLILQLYLQWLSPFLSHRHSQKQDHLPLHPLGLFQPRREDRTEHQDLMPDTLLKNMTCQGSGMGEEEIVNSNVYYICCFRNNIHYVPNG